MFFKSKVKELERKLLEEKSVSRDLIANVSHELRTPIAGMEAILENLNDGVTEWNLATAKTLIKSCERLSETVNYMLDISRVDSKEGSLNLELVDAEDYLEEVVESVEMLEPQKNLSFEIAVVSGTKLLIDKARFSGALTNLLTNAIRFSPTDSKIICRCFETLKNSKKFSVIQIIDYGKGVDSKQADQIFKRFKTSALESSNKTGGTGIGLSIARWIVNLHSGDLRLLEKDNKIGATFEITVPKFEQAD